MHKLYTDGSNVMYSITNGLISYIVRYLCTHAHAHTHTNGDKWL